MMFTEEELSELKASVSRRISEKRFLHTLGVLEAALYLADISGIASKSEIAAAAILHDVTKEISYDEQLFLIKSFNLKADKEDLAVREVIHSLTAPLIIERDFPIFATEKVISAVKHHTLGSPDMSLFDEIIFLADFIEPNRKYDACREVREFVYNNTSRDSKEANVNLIHKASVMAIDSTINNLILNKKIISAKTVLTRNVILGKINNVF